ncbi:MAG: hypothetical protein RQ729_01255 [Wenzhouxiangellaceae bacterium]|nr:hypothetical protein [Wenzhouxiangellaceae bacterium]
MTRILQTGPAWLLLAGGVAAWAETPEQPPTEDVELACRDPEGRPESWLDRTHSYLSRKLCEPAAWFDGFFGGERAYEETTVGSFFRLRNSLVWDQSRDFGHDIQLSANIRLPQVSDRVRLLISRDETLEGDGNIGDIARDPDDENQTRLGLRLLLSDLGRTQFDVDGTIKVSGGGLNPRVRGRVRHTRGLTDTTLARWTQSLFWERDDGFGTTSRADFEWLPNRLTLVRLTGRGTVSQESDGIDWRTGLIGFRQLDRKSAVRSEIGAFGFTDPGLEAEEWFVNVRYRRSFLRDWLFYELQPEHAWPIDENTGRRRADWRFIFTLEIQFENPAIDRERIDHYRGR